jgi:predicted ATPase
VVPPPPDVPLSITRLVRDRISMRSTEVADVLRWAAVLGGSFDPTQLQRLLALDAESFVGALEQLERHDYLRFEGTRSCSFSHEIVRAAVYDALSSPRRQLMHTRVARLLSEENDPSGALAGELSRHAALAGDAELAVRACITAGKRCLRLSASVDAYALSRRGLAYVAGLREPERTTLEIELLQLGILARRPLPEEGLEERLALLSPRALELGAISHASTATYLRALLKWEDGHSADAVRFTREIERISRLGRPEERLQGLGEAASCLTHLERDLLEAEAYVLEAEQLAAQHQIQASSVLGARAGLLRYRGQLAEAAETLERARALAQHEGDRLGEMLIFEELFEVQLARTDLASARHTAHELLALSERSRPGSELPFARAALQLVEYAASDAPERPELDAALLELAQADAKQRSAYLLARAAEIALARGAHARAAAQADEALALARRVELPSEAALALSVRAQVAQRCAEGEVLTRARGELEGLARGPLSARGRSSVEAALARLGSVAKEKADGARHRRTRVR